ncbi:MAG: acetoin utilization protein AcuC [Candidatus Brockarchaeota archaeon]|nr:acetoin utilization protein AcuC [Candidatus Brockarchaeota archaeon]
MTGITAFVFSDEYMKYQFGPTHPMQPIRLKLTFDLLKRIGAFGEKARHYVPAPAREEEIRLVHSKDYVDFVKRASSVGGVMLDRGDTPAVKGIYEGASSVVGGSICCAKLLAEKEVAHAFNPGGGLHHAKEGSASGFCVFNDVAIATRVLQKKGFERIVILDVDGHHGDGTQEIFYSEPILKISMHRSGVFFFPGSGFVDEIGKGEGEGYSVNIPLPPGTDDDSYLYAFEQVAVPLIRAYRPQIILNQFGVDGHYEDPLVGLSLTTRTFGSVASAVHDLAHEFCEGKYLLFGGGGYDPENTARCWALVFLTVSEAASREEISRLSDTYRPPKSDEVAETVQRTIAEVKKVVFPYHGIPP